MSERTRVAVIGLGGIGLHHVRNFESCPQARLVALCDRDADWLTHTGREHPGYRLYTDHHQVLQDQEVEAIALCLPTILHSRLTIEALQAGKHVLVEKPMACNAEEARPMVAAAQASGKLLMVSQNQRFTTEAQFLHRIIEEGRLGSIYHVRTGWRRPLGMFPSPVTVRATGTIDRNWFNQRQVGGGVLRDLGSHMLDLSMWLLGFPAVADVLGANYSVFSPAFAAEYGAVADAEDFATGMIRFENGATLQLETSFGVHTDLEEVYLELYGTRGGAALRNGQLKVFGGDHGAHSVETMRFTQPGGSPQAEFVQAIQAGRPPLVTGEQGVRIIELLDALYARGIQQI